jgi:hypothetical protein
MEMFDDLNGNLGFHAHDLVEHLFDGNLIAYLQTILIDRPADSRASPSGQFVPGEKCSCERRLFSDPSLSNLMTCSVRNISSLSCIDLS